MSLSKTVLDIHSERLSGDRPILVTCLPVQTVENIGSEAAGHRPRPTGPRAQFPRPGRQPEELLGVAAPEYGTREFINGLSPLNRYSSRQVSMKRTTRRNSPSGAAAPPTQSGTCSHAMASGRLGKEQGDVPLDKGMLNSVAGEEQIEPPAKPLTGIGL